MSWDVMIFKFAGTPPKSADSILEDSRLPLGPAVEVRESISAILPTINWSDPAWGIYDGDVFSIEFNVGEDDPIDNMMLHVRGGGEAVAAIMSVVHRLGWSALDCSTGEFLDPHSPSDEGWKSFQQYRDKINDLENSSDG